MTKSWMIICKFDDKDEWSLAAWMKSKDEAERFCAKMATWNGVNVPMVVSAGGLKQETALELLERMGRE